MSARQQRFTERIDFCPECGYVRPDEHECGKSEREDGDAA